MAKKNKGIPERKRLAAIFISFTILIMGGISLFENMSLDYYSVLGTLKKTIPASIVLGSLGWVMGMILDKPRKRFGSGYNNLFLNNMIKDDFSTSESTEGSSQDLSDEENESLSNEEVS